MGEAQVALRPTQALSAAQELLWAGQQLHRDAPISNMATLSEFGAPIDPDRFVAAFDAVVAASDTLRTTVAERGGVPQPSVAGRLTGATTVIDLDDADVATWVAERLAAPLDLTSCGFDSVLIRRPGDRWSWYLCLHHVLTDATSSSLVFRATAAAYEGRSFSVGVHRHHVDQMTQRRRSASWQRAREYWASHRPPPSDAVRLFGPPDQPVSRSERVEVPMAGGQAEAYRTLLSGELAGLSPDLSRLASMATTLAVTLHRLGGLETIRIGVPVHHRSTEDTRALVGLLMELYPITITVAPDDTFRSIHERSLRECITMLRRAEPGAGPRPDFEVVLNVVGASFGSFGAIDATTDWLHSGHVDPVHRLRGQVYDFTGDGQLRIALDVSESLGGGDCPQRAAEVFGRVFAAFVNDPDAGVGSFPLVGDSERRAILDASRAVVEPAAWSGPVDVVEALRARSSDPVISDGLRALTGGELADAIDDTASWLAERGVGPGDRVAVQMARSIDAVVAVHAVLRAGAAFCPIDPDLPATRRRDLLSDLDPAMVLETLPDPGERNPASLVRHRQVAPDDIAYLLFTSGSTGIPKGVPISHLGLQQYLAFAQAAYLDGEPPVVALHSSLSFDLTVTSLFLPFLAGGRMEVINASGAEGLRQIADGRSVTFLKATPSHLELLVRMIDAHHPLRTLIVGGEAFGADLANRFLQVRPGLAIFNEYGPTEAVVGCMIHRFDPARDRGVDVPIGRAAPGVRLFTLDRCGHLSPQGASGELHVSRPGMAKGYWHRPELTAERFVSRPDLCPDPLYRTGDLVRLIDANTLVYEGRLDEQLKLGGIRIEPGEIEAALTSHPAVEQSAVRVWHPSVSARNDEDGCRRCGLTTEVPGVRIDEGICSMCRQFESVAERADQYFGTLDDLDRIVTRARRRRQGPYDCLHLLSGGKDSTYSLYQLVERGFSVRALTLDNGFISAGAKENVARVVTDLGVDHEFVTTDAMNEIFRDSLDRYSNVCNGCFKVLYTLAVHRADDLGIPLIVTGLSRGQFFETRLTPAQFSRGGFDPAAIDQTVLEARKAYHRENDAVSRLLDVSIFATDDVFERIEFVDYYRYTDVELDEMLSFLAERAPWIRPADTGRSTNCLVNAAGIHVHRLERGFHNYALPYSWDVRLGHKTRAEAVEELDDPIVTEEVDAMLAEIGYRPRPAEILTGWYVAAEEIEPDELRRHLARLLPAHAVPSAFVRVDAIPLNDNGKVAVSRLPAPDRTQRLGDQEPAATETEEVIAGVWARVLGLEEVSVTAPFFDQGGTSLRALEMIVAVSEAVGTEIPERLAFRHRTVRDLATVVDELLREAVDRGEVAMVPVVSDRSSGPLPLSVGEETLLFHARSHPDDVRYNVTRLYTIEGSIDPDRLVDAVATVVGHHQPLHTSYGPDRRDLGIEESLQVIRRSMPDHQAVREWAEGEKSRPFDLVHGPLVRLGLGDVGPDRWAALVAVPHIVADAGALDVFWEQVAAAYDGEEPPPLPLTYAALADQHRTRHRQDRTDARFWRAHREGRDRAPFLAVERPVPPEPDGYVHRALDRCASDLAQGPGRTAFSVALAAFSVVLQRHGRGGEPEVAVTSSIRDHPDAERLVGYFLNPLPVRVRAEPADSFAAVCARADEAIADALAHRTYPYAWMVRDARAEGATAPPVDVMLAYEDLVPPRLGAARVEHQILASGRAVTDLTGFVQVRGRSVELGIEYSGSVMGQAAARRLLDDFAAVIEAGLDDPHRPVGALRPGESILAGPDLGPIEHVGPLVDAHPAMAPAVRCGAVSLDYGRLRARRDELAAVLAAHDVAVGHRVGLVLRRSTDAVAAMLACWQVGAAYVPIDPTQPLSRIRALVEAVAPSVVLVDDRASWSGPIGTAVVLGLDQPPGPTTPVVDARPGPGAYVIFTSGTTGRPKAVEITHENLAASMAARGAYFPDRPDRFLMVSAFSFDSSMVGLHWTLAEGGEVVLPTEDEVHDPDRLVDLIGEAAVTHTLMVPSLYGAVLARGDARRLRSLATVIVAGEACPADLVGRHHRVIDAELVNEYGPTETTIWATAHRCRADERTVPIGRPISGVTVAVMDAFGEVVPAGVAGELWISGPTVADGYLTGEDGGFVVREGQRWYRTGDRVRTAPDAEHLLFLGRVDEQLSLGGRRVEPGEIEQHLMTHPGVHRAAVGLAREPVAGFDALRRIEPADVSALLRQAADEDDPASALAELVAEDAGPGVLVALLEAGPDVDPVRVREQLATVLPAALVPRRISLVADLPLLPNGKLDRSAVDWSAARTSEEAPRPSGGTETTRAVVESFRTAFADPTIDDDSDFFDLGGDSLLAVALAANLEELLGRTIPINALVDARTPARLAAALEPSGLGLVADDLLVPLRRSGTATPMLAISPGGGHVLGYEPLVQALPMDIPVWGLRLPGSDSREQPAATVEALVDRFEREVSTRFPVGPLQLVGFSTGGLGAYELARCLARRGRTVELVVLIDTVFPGRQHAVSDRRQRVRDLLAQRDLRGLVADAWDAAHRRGSPLWAGVRRRWSAARGTTVSPTLNEAYLYRAAHRAATAYRPGPYDGPVLVVRASQTDPELTSTPWTTLAPAARVEVVDGSHFGDGGLMRGEPVRHIARLIAGATTDLS